MPFSALFNVFLDVPLVFGLESLLSLLLLFPESLGESEKVEGTAGLSLMLTCDPLDLMLVATTRRL